MSPSAPRDRVIPDSVARRARLAVALLFVANGLTFASLVPWMPIIKAELGLTNTALGVAVGAMPLGALAFGAAAGPLIVRVGSARTATSAAIIAALALPAVALASSWLMFAGAMFVLGAGDAVTDSAMNAHGLRVQRRYGRSIINGFHALWSLGAVAGGLLAATAAGFGVGRPTHLIVTTVVLVVAVAGISRWLLPGPEHTERTEEAAGGVGTGGVLHALSRAPLVLLGIAGLLMMSGAVENTAATWSAVYLSDSLHAGPFVAGLGFVAAQVAMVVARGLGDRVVDRFGAAVVVRMGSLLAALGMGLAIAWPTPVVAIVGFGLAGLGIATLFPLGLAAAGEVPGVRSGDGVAVTAWLARIGFLVTPPLIGAMADATTLRMALGIALVAALIAALLSRFVAPHPASVQPSTPG